MGAVKKTITFRLPSHLIERLKELAQRDHRSLNNYVEMLLLDAVYNEPNEETRQAFEDAKAGKLEGSLDVSSVEAMYIKPCIQFHTTLNKSASYPAAKFGTLFRLCNSFSASKWAEMLNFHPSRSISMVISFGCHLP